MFDIGSVATNWLRTAHTARAYVDVTTPSTFPYGTSERLDIHDGTVDMDASAMVRSTANLTFSPDVWPRAQLWPWYGARLKITYVIGAVDMVTPPVLVPFAPMIVETTSRSLPGSEVEVQASDLFRLPEYADFPWPIRPWAEMQFNNRNYNDLLVWLLSSSGLQPNPTNLLRSNPLLPDLTLEASRGRLEYLRDAADTVLCDVWADRAGYWSAQPVDRLQAVVWAIDASASGVMLSAQDEVSGERVRNDIVVSSEQANGQLPVYSRGQDVDPNSPTYIAGPFGKRTYKRSSGFIRDSAGMANLVRALLAQQKLLRIQSKFSTPPAPHLDPLDLVNVSMPFEEPATRQIETISHSLTGGPCDIGVKSWVYGS